MSARRFLTPKQKIAVVREHLIEKVPVSEVCEKRSVSVVNSYKWQKQLFENGEAAFEGKTNAANARRQQDANAVKLEKLEAKLQQTNEVIA